MASSMSPLSFCSLASKNSCCTCSMTRCSCSHARLSPLPGLTAKQNNAQPCHKHAAPHFTTAHHGTPRHPFFCPPSSKPLSAPPSTHSAFLAQEESKRRATLLSPTRRHCTDARTRRGFTSFGAQRRRARASASAALALPACKAEAAAAVVVVVV